MKRALVAGGAGFLGSQLCQSLLDKEYEVWCIDAFTTGRTENIQHLLHRREFHVVRGDICHKPRFSVRFHEIYNLASPASPKYFTSDGLAILDTAALGHRNLLELSRDTDARILLASSSEVYGDPLEHPQTESYRGHVNCTGERSS